MTSSINNPCCADDTNPGCCTPTGTEMSFSLQKRLEHPATVVWDALCDWEGHSAWVPLTSVEMLSSAVDRESFVAYTGLRPLRLEDNMHVVSRDNDAMCCVVEKTGPVLLGTASFSVTPVSETSCIVEWVEHLSLARGPRPLRALLKLTAVPARAGFALALRSLDRSLARSSSST
jgi:hypothetical protein